MARGGLHAMESISVMIKITTTASTFSLVRVRGLWQRGTKLNEVEKEDTLASLPTYALE